MYKLYLDKSEDFTCEVSVKNASLKGSMARLIVESDGLNLVFNGRIEGDKCIIPVKKLRGLLDENTRGNMHLEVIVEDTYFKPWKSDFVVEEHTSVKVTVNEQHQKSNKPTVEVKVSQPKKPILKSKVQNINVYTPLNEISMICKKFGIRKNNLKKRKNDFLEIIKEYFKVNFEYNKHSKLILSSITNFLN